MSSNLSEEMRNERVNNNLNQKDYKYEDGKMYVRASVSEPIYVSFDEILTKKDVVKLVDVFGNYMTTMFLHRGDIGKEQAEYFRDELVKLREVLLK